MGGFTLIFCRSPRKRTCIEYIPSACHFTARTKHVVALNARTHVA